MSIIKDLNKQDLHEFQLGCALNKDYALSKGFKFDKNEALLFRNDCKISFVADCDKGELQWQVCDYGANGVSRYPRMYDNLGAALRSIL